MYNELGWELISYILSDSAIDPGLDYTTRMGKVPTVNMDVEVKGMVKDFQVPILFLFIKMVEQVTKTLDFKIVKWLGLNDSVNRR